MDMKVVSHGEQNLTRIRVSCKSSRVAGPIPSGSVIHNTFGPGDYSPCQLECSDVLFMANCPEISWIADSDGIVRKTSRVLHFIRDRQSWR
jgi:hypothetical protein